MKFLLTDREIKALKNKLKEEAVEEYKKSIEHGLWVQSKRMEDRETCDFTFDFTNPNVNVFSIERVDWGTANERTTIGYYLKKEADAAKEPGDKVIREWTLLCSRTQHNQLVQEFNNYKKSKG